MSATKLRHFDQLIREAESLRGAGRRVVLCHGVFDLVHIGHIRYLQQARQLGDALIVTITPDCHVNKGPHRPIFTEDVRLDWLAALDCVDFTAINLWPTAVEAIANLRPDIFAKGGEYRDNKTPELLREEKAIADSGGQMVFIDDFTSSSSSLINNHLSPFSYEVNEYLQGIRQRHSSDEILDWLEKTSDLRLLVIGEAVLDEHYNCTVLGRSNNAPIVATRYESHVRRPAGALAIADYLSQFCEEVHLATMIGDSPSERGWIESRAAENVRCRFIEKRDCPTIVRRRYRESYFDAPLFEINDYNDRPLDDDEQAEFLAALEDVGQFDAVVVADYGHTFFTPPSIATIEQSARYLAVSAPAHAANFGFHTIAKHDRADFAVIARRDLELELRERDGDLERMLQSMADRLRARRFIVTLGGQGCLAFDRDEGIHRAQGVSTNVVDRSGGGDAFFAISSLAAAAGAPIEIVSLLGNAAGAQAVATVGAELSIDALALQRHLQSLLK